MSLFTKLGNEIASPVDVGGNLRPVENVDFQRWMTEVERILAVFQAGGGIVFPDLATANGSLAYNANQMAWVMGDPTPANNGVYRKIGASGAGSWARIGDLPYSMIRLDNAGAGTADAIVATPMLPLPTTPGAALFTVNILADNTGPVTINGKPLRTNSGNEISAGGLTVGSIHAFLDLGDHFRLLSDQASAAVLLGAEAARDAALAAAAAISTAPQWAFADKASVLLFEPAVAPATISVDGYLYDYSPTEPAHAGKVVDKAGNFYPLRRSPAIYLEAFRDDLDLDGPGDSSAGIAKAIGMLKQEGGGKLILPTEAEINGLWDIDFGRLDIDFNGCLLRAPDGADPAIVSAAGEASSTAYELAAPVTKGAMSLQCTTTVSGIAAGNIIKVEDDSARLSDSSTQINVELIKVASVSGDTIHLAEPLNRSKTAWAGNIRRVDLLNDLSLRNGRTAALTGATGNAGLLLQRLGPGAVVDWISHENGVGDALSLRSCWGVDYNLRHAKPAQLVVSGQGYAVSIIRGSRFCDGAVYGEGQRHTFDYDSSWDCRARVKSVGEVGSIAFSHNGAGGRLSLDIDMIGCESETGITASTWKDITGNGAYNDEDSVYEGLRIRATIHQLRNSTAEYGLIANMALRDCDIDVAAVLGDGASYSANNSMAVRIYPNGSTGKVRVHSRGYNRALGVMATVALTTSPAKGIKADIDVDWAAYGAFYQYADEVNLGRFIVGPNISTKVLYCFSNATAKLYGFQIDDMTCAVSDITKYEDINATGIGDFTKGAIGRITSPFANFSANGNFTITQNMMLAAGRVIAMSLGGNSTLTGIEDGLFEGHTLVILRRGTGTLTVADISSQLTLKTSPQNINTLMLVWQDGVWWEV